MHHSELSTGPAGPLKANDFVIRFSFKLDGAKSLGVGLENPQGHVARAAATPDAFEIVRWGGAKATRKVPLTPGTWHTVVWEIRGAEMVARLDDHPPLYVEDEGLKAEKPRLVLLNYGQSACFDDVKVWKAEPNDAWPERRAKLKQAGE